jgi:hypothetical protein
MPITNIVDRRKRHHRFETVNAIVEAAWHDNLVNDSDQVEQPANDDGPVYDQREHICGRVGNELQTAGDSLPL